MSRPPGPGSPPRTRAPSTAVVAPPTGRETPRIAFGSFVERGILTPGTTVTDKQRRIAAEVTAEGDAVSGTHRGSIHQVGAAVQNAPSCNGWTFWHFERNGALVPLDVLRKEDQPELPKRRSPCTAKKSFQKPQESPDSG